METWEDVISILHFIWSFHMSEEQSDVGSPKEDRECFDNQEDYRKCEEDLRLCRMTWISRLNGMWGGYHSRKRNLNKHEQTRSCV